MFGIPLTKRELVYIFRTGIEIINGISSAVSTSVTGLSLAGGRILDFKFLNDSSLLLLWAAQGQPDLLLSEQISCLLVLEPNSSPVVLNVPFQSLSYTGYHGRVPEPVRIDEQDISQAFSPATFGELSDLAPTRMQVLASSSTRGDVPGRVYLLGRDRVTYKAFTLPEKW